MGTQIHGITLTENMLKKKEILCNDDEDGVM